MEAQKSVLDLFSTILVNKVLFASIAHQTGLITLITKTMVS